MPQIRPQAALRHARVARPREPIAAMEGLTVEVVPDIRFDPQEESATVAVAFSVGGETGYLTTVTPVLQRLIARAGLPVRPDRLDTELAAMVLETVLLDPIEALEERLGVEVGLLDLGHGASRPDLASLSVILHMGGEDTAFPATIHASPALLAMLARYWERQPPRNGDVDPPPFTLACRVAFTELDVAALRALDVGDAMLFDRVAVPGGAAVVVAEALHATAHFDEQGYLYLSEAFRPPERYALGDFLMSDEDDSDHQVQAISEAAIDELPVRLVFEVGRKTLSLDELRTLAVGSPVPLDRAASSAVQIFANGRRIGAGEMVMIGEQLGVRITQLNGRA